MTLRNETDVREEIAMRLLDALGYKTGTANDIIREQNLRYSRVFLGRKKKSDPYIVGKPDYILKVFATGCWVLETKGPSDALGLDEIEQTLSYARHPEVSAKYACLTNGKRFLLYESTQASSEAPLIDIPIKDVATLVGNLRSVLSPEALKRDCKTPNIELGEPLALGLRPSVNVVGGHVKHTSADVKPVASLPKESDEILGEMTRRLEGLRNEIKSGKIWRDDHSYLRATIEFGTVASELESFIEEKGLNNLEWICPDEYLSCEQLEPNIFDITTSLEMHPGEDVFDIVSWSKVTVPIKQKMNIRGQAIGSLNGDEITGVHYAVYNVQMPIPHAPQIEIYLEGDFIIKLDIR